MIRRLYPYIGLFLLIETLTRVSLLVRVWQEVGITYSDALKALGIGLWFDLVILSFFLIPAALLYIFAPTRKRPEKVLRFGFVFLLLFTTLSEHVFWTEFSTRFNFIAVDYLVYTQEVIGNIRESYPVFWLLLLVAVVAMLLTRLSYRWFDCPSAALAIPSMRKRLTQLAMLLVACIGLTSITTLEWTQFSDNSEASEAASNGIYNLFYAFANNEINYAQFYARESKAEATKDTRALLADSHTPYATDTPDEFTRVVRGQGKEKHKNVIIVVMESMSAEFMGAFGDTNNLTPNLDRLAKEGLFFSNLYATGTRTVRGLEAVTLSIPPTPGQSIIRRPGNENLFSLGFIFKDRGYDTRFLYGGYGYFDNMNAFFAANGFDITDRTMMKEEEIQFANVWGVCDEDMVTRAIKEADRSYKKGSPFMTLWMTTSNHRPYTYPDGRIDLPSKTSGRIGGVKYADYAVGKLIEDAKKKPWFKDTVFIFVADHTAGAGGKAELDARKYHIPMIFYAPDMIQPQRIERLVSQIDLAPTLLGLLNFSYYSKFYGLDVLHSQEQAPRAFISNYQKVALVEHDDLTILAPKRKITQVHWPDNTAMDAPNLQEQHDAIALYQSASWWRERYKRIPTVVK